MGFPAGCVSCHGNHHHDAKATLCAKCHVPSYFVPSTFKHPKTGCQRCHTPPHPDRGACLRCHTQHSWASHFQHPFPLAGPHSSFACERCHTNGINAPGRDCTGCHKPPHPVYGSCLTCHSMSSWASHFAHPIALGAHSSFACSRCHVNGINSAPVGCSSCHGSKHGGLTNCVQCHTMSYFVPSTFHHPAAGRAQRRIVRLHGVSPRRQLRARLLLLPRRQAAFRGLTAFTRRVVARVTALVPRFPSAPGLG